MSNKPNLHEDTAAQTKKSKVDASEIIFLGLDLGTSQSAIATSTGLKLNVASIVGWPKDFIASNVVKKPIVFGDECIKYRTSLNVIYPLEKGVIKHREKRSAGKKNVEKEAKAAIELLKYLLSLVERRDNQKIFAVVVAPARSTMDDKKAIIDAAVGMVDSIMVVSEPFLVAYSLGLFGNTIIVDLGWTHRYNDRILLNVEVDFEHAAKEMELEFAFLDFLITDTFNIRAGSMLMPVGYLNEFHEPPLFYSVERPYVQKNVIPTTWQEGGVGIFGSLKHDVNYRLYVVNGLDGSKFKAGSGIRSGRHKGGEAPSDNLAIVGRLEYNGLNGAKLGFSGYRGNAGQGTDGLGDTGVTLVEADIRYALKDFEFTGLYSKIIIDDTKKIFDVNNQPGLFMK